MIRGIHHTGVNCRDIDRMKAFYCEAFGFEPVDDEFNWENDAAIDNLIDVRNSAARGVVLRAGTCYVELFQYSAPPPSSREAKRPNDLGYTHLCVDVTDIEKDIKHLERCGMTFNGRAFVEMGGVKAIYGYDPEGNVIEVQQTTPQVGFELESLDRPATSG